jgi:hypothetical protein
VSKTLKPGEPAPQSGIYNMIGPRGREDQRAGGVNAAQAAAADPEAGAGLPARQARSSPAPRQRVIT